MADHEVAKCEALTGDSQPAMTLKRTRLMTPSLNSLMALPPCKSAAASSDTNLGANADSLSGYNAVNSDSDRRLIGSTSFAHVGSESASGSEYEEDASYEYSDDIYFSESNNEEEVHQGGSRYYQDKWRDDTPSSAQSDIDNESDDLERTTDEAKTEEYLNQQQLWFLKYSSVSNSNTVITRSSATSSTPWLTAVADLHTSEVKTSSRPLFLPPADEEEDMQMLNSKGETKIGTETGTEFDQIKQIRLQRLLSRTDRIVDNLHSNMQAFILQQKEKEAREVQAPQGTVTVEVAIEPDTSKGKSKIRGEQSKADEAVMSTNIPLSNAGTLGEATTKLSVQNTTTALNPNSPGKYLRERALRDYQLGGLEWLSSLHAQGLNGILADEMGLGKTLTVLSFFAALWEKYGLWGPHVVVVPMSVLSSWKSEVGNFLSGFFDVYTHHGPKDQRRDDFVRWKSRMLAAKQAKQRAAASATTTSLASLLGGSGAGSSVVRAWPKGVPMFQVSLFFTTYDIAIKDCKLLQKLGRGQLRWQYLVVDEAHRLKSRSSVLFESLGKANAARRLLLTGTPLQNNLGELWALLSFVLPEIFQDIQQYAEWFNKPFEMQADDETAAPDTAAAGSADEQSGVATKSKGRSKLAKGSNRRNSKLVPRGGASLSTSNALSVEERALIVTSIQRIIKPFLLRRLKRDVIAELPLKVERTIVCPMSTLQQRVYDIIRKSVEDAERGDEDALDTTNLIVNASAAGAAETPEPRASGRIAGSSANKKRDSSKIFSSGVSFNNVLMHLRKLCNHPFLVLEDMANIPDDLYYRHVVSASGKLCVLERLLRHLLLEKHKILIFSQMTTTLDILQGYLSSLNIRSYRLDGSTSREEREANIAAFSDPLDTADVPIYLLSTRAGGVGINLQAADTVIFYDSDWNPQVDMQAMSRVHRLGQKEVVLVLRLVTCGHQAGVLSAEQRILRTAAHKLVAEQVVLEDGQFDMGTSTGRLTPSAGAGLADGDLNSELRDDMSELLSAGPAGDTEHGALSLFACEDEENGNKTSDSASNSSNLAEAVDATTAAGAAAASVRALIKEFATPVLYGMESLSEEYIRAVCVRNPERAHSNHVDKEGNGERKEFKPVEIALPMPANATYPLTLGTLEEAMDWSPWIGMPPGFEDQLRAELRKLKRENRIKLEKLRAEEEEAQRQKAAAAQLLLDQALAAKAEALAAVEARRSERALKKAARVEAAAAKAAAKLARSSEKAAKVAAKTLGQEEFASPDNVRAVRIRMPPKSLQEDALWDAALQIVDSDSTATSPLVLATGGKRPVGRPRKRPLQTPSPVRASRKRVATMRNELAGDTDLDAVLSDACVVCGGEVAPSMSAASGFQFPDNEVNLSAREREHLMVQCESCAGAFHVNCVGLLAVPNGHWQCLMCASLNAAHQRSAIEGDPKQARLE